MSELITQLIIGAGGAIAGSIVGGGISWAQGRSTAKETLTRDREARRAREKAGAFNVTVKLMEIVNGIEDLRRHIEEMISAADTAGNADLMLWQKVMPLSGVSDRELVFEAIELASLVEGRENDLVADLLLLGKRYHATVLVVLEYASRRRELGDMLTPSEMNGEVGSVLLTRDEMMRVMPRAVELNSAVAQLRATLPADFAFGLQVAARFGAFGKRYFADPAFPVIGMPTNATRAAEA